MIIHTYDSEREWHWHIAPLNTNKEPDHQLLQELGFQLSCTESSAMNSAAVRVTSSETYNIRRAMAFSAQQNM
jgi:hypothetical protein